MITFGMIINRYEFSTKEIKDKYFLFIKKVFFDNILDIWVR